MHITEPVEADVGLQYMYFQASHSLFLLRDANKLENLCSQVQENKDTSNNEDTDIEHSHEEVRNDAYVCSLLLLRLGGCPVQSVQDVLAKRGEQPICHLTAKQGKDQMWE